MEKEEITIELLYRKLENRLTEEEVKHFEIWMQDIDHQRYYQNLQSFYELREDDPEDVEMLQDMVIAAVNEAVRAAMEDMSSSMGKITGGMNLPF